MYKIKINKTKTSFKVVSVENQLSIKSVDKKFSINTTGKRGLKGDPGSPGEPGPKGDTGAGVPTGGTTGQVLSKKSNQDFDTEWAFDAGADKHYEQAFTFQSSVVVNHNLGKYPAVTVVDSTESEVVADVVYNDVNKLTVMFNAENTGKIYCN